MSPRPEAQWKADERVRLHKSSNEALFDELVEFGCDCTACSREERERSAYEKQALVAELAQRLTLWLTDVENHDATRTVGYVVQCQTRGDPKWRDISAGDGFLHSSLRKAKTSKARIAGMARAARPGELTYRIVRRTLLTYDDVPPTREARPR